MPRLGGAVSLSMEHLHTSASGLAQNERAQAEALFAKAGILPSLGAVYSCMRKPGRSSGASSSRREPPAQCQHSPGSGLPVRPTQNNTLVVAHTAERAAPQACLALRMALIVSWGPLGARPTQARRVLRHRAAGPWRLVGRRLEDPQPSDGYSGLPVSSAGCHEMCSEYIQTDSGERRNATWWLGIVGERHN